MAHFAELDNNNTVLRVIVINNQNALDENGDPSETHGAMFCANLLGGVWIQTSYNTYANAHSLGGTPFRKNYAGIGYTYDLGLDAFIAPKPFASWVLNETSCIWEAPVPMPTDDKQYRWDEATTSWIEVTNE